MSLTALTTLLPLAAEEAEGGISPYVVGAGTLAILLALMVALLVFGAGREHS